MRWIRHWSAVLGMVGLLAGAAEGVSGAGGPLYLPLVQRNYNPLAVTRRINAPYFPDADILATKFSEMGIFWFGQIAPDNTYTDVRVAYNATELVIYTATIDRRLWYDTSPAAADLTAWDSVSVYLDLAGGSDAPTATAYRFEAQLNNGGAVPANAKASFRGNGTGWAAAAVAFTANAGWRGGAINDGTDDKGWVMTFRIPFASLGVAQPAAGAAAWRLAVITHNRNAAAGPVLADQMWPETATGQSLAAWGQLRWSLPAYTPPASSLSGTVTLRHKLNGTVVQDAGVGGSSTCGFNNNTGQYLDFWTQWGEANQSVYNNPPTGLVVQNQDDISDWPCFSKAYLTFPLTAVPAGKVIRSATLTLHQTGGSGPASNNQNPVDEYIQVLTTGQDWSGTAITWNNAPLALENFSGTWVPNLVGCGSTIPWPCVARDWDVAGPVAQAYASGSPVRLILYSANTGYSTGKYFTGSQTEDWNSAGRPTLTIQYGNP